MNVISGQLSAVSQTVLSAAKYMKKLFGRHKLGNHPHHEWKEISRSVVVLFFWHPLHWTFMCCAMLILLFVLSCLSIFGYVEKPATLEFYYDRTPFLLGRYRKWHRLINSFSCFSSYVCLFPLLFFLFLHSNASYAFRAYSLLHDAENSSTSCVQKSQNCNKWFIVWQ